MTPERHARIQAIFDAAIELPIQLRLKYLDEHCDGDPDLRLHIERLLQATEEPETLSEDSNPQSALVKECPICSRCFESPTLTCSHDGAHLESRFHGHLLVHGKYLIQRSLGRGAMGAVYLAKHIGLGKEFALKLILVEGVIPSHYLQNFENEARALGRLKHPNIVNVTDYGVDPNAEGLPYLVMEYLEGQTLRQVLKQVHTLPVPQVLTVFGPIAAALDAAHEQNIVHGDLKPSNIFIARQPDSSEVVKVVDFGLATLQLPNSGNQGAGVPLQQGGEKGSERSGQIRGTPPYMAPELFQEKGASPATDRFAFGVVLYEALTGFLPYGEHFGEVLGNLSKSPVSPSQRNGAVPKELDGPVLALIERRPSDRPATASAAIQAMEQAYLKAQQREWRTQESPRRLVWALVTTALIVMVAGLLGTLHYWQVLEERTWDARLAMLPRHSIDSRLLVVTLDDATIAADTRPLADVRWADEFGQNLDRILANGARGVAVDLLLPSNWSQSVEFARMVGRNVDRLVLALFSSSNGTVIGDECISPLLGNMLGPERYRNLFAFVNLYEDEDRVIRAGRVAYRDRGGGSRLSFAARLARIALGETRSLPAESPVWIDYSARLEDLPRISWKDLRNRLETEPRFFENKLVIVGADYEGAGDENRVPAFVSRNLVPGVLLQALIVNTILRGVRLRAYGLVACLCAAGICSLGIIALALRFPHRFRWILPGACATLLLYLGSALVILRISHGMLKIVAPSIAILLAILLAWGLKSYLRPYPSLERLRIFNRRPLRLLSQNVLCTLLLFGFPIRAADCCKGSVAVLASLSGQVSVRSSGVAKPGSMLDWLQPGVAIQVGKNSKATVILLNGRRYEIGSGARAIVSAEGLVNAIGPVRELEPLPPIPKATPILERDAGRPGAVRLRGAAPIRSMYPRESFTALPDALKLSFGVIPEASAYRVELKDAEGNVLENIQTSGASVTIPSGIIQAGAIYSWHVRAIGPPGVVGEGEVRFETISEQDAKLRRELAAALTNSEPDAFRLALLADVDLRLGLIEEARQEFEAALKLHSDDQAIRNALNTVQRALAELQDPLQ